LFTAISWLFSGSSKSKKSSFVANCADAEVEVAVSVVVALSTIDYSIVTANAKISKNFTGKTVIA